MPGRTQTATSYAQRFQQSGRRWREALADAELPVLTVQLNRVYQPADPDADRHWSQVREDAATGGATDAGHEAWCRRSTCRLRI